MSRGSLDFEGYRDGKYDQYNNTKQELEPEHYEYTIRNLGKCAMNCHHIMWNANNHHDCLRAMEIFQPQMYKPAHVELHRGCEAVPKYNKKVLHVIEARFEPTNDIYESLDRLLLLINGMDIDTVKPERKDMYIHSLESQISYLRGNIQPAKGYHK